MLYRSVDSVKNRQVLQKFDCWYRTWISRVSTVWQTR